MTTMVKRKRSAPQKTSDVAMLARWQRALRAYVRYAESLISVSEAMAVSPSKRDALYCKAEAAADRLDEVRGKVQHIALSISMEPEVIAAWSRTSSKVAILETFHTGKRRGFRPLYSALLKARALLTHMSTVMDGQRFDNVRDRVRPSALATSGKQRRTAADKAKEPILPALAVRLLGFLKAAPPDQVSYEATLSAGVGKSRTTVRPALAMLKRLGLADRLAVRGGWHITENGRAAHDRAHRKSAT